MSTIVIEDQQLIQGMVREFADTEVQPIAAEIDKKHEFGGRTGCGQKMNPHAAYQETDKGSIR